MADHLMTAEFQSFRPPLPFLDVDQNMEFLTHLSADLIPSVPISSVTSLNFQNSLVSDDSFFSGNHVAPEFPSISVSDSFLQQNRYGFVSTDVPKVEMQEQRKRKAVEISGSRICESKRKYHSSGRAKRKKSDKKEDEKPREIVHVRARRGQATDSHSLAERVRRGKINERLKCLQDIVPGCYKTMGMAMMLDEIINYVQSLQNQVEFLSMKLTAASSFYDFNSESDTIDKTQRSMARETKEMERWMRTQLSTWHS